MQSLALPPDIQNETLQTHDNPVEVSFSVPPQTEERTVKEVEALIAQMSKELTTSPDEPDAMQKRLDALQGFKSSGGAVSSRRQVDTGPGEAPIFDPYEYELAASGSEDDSGEDPE